MLEAPVSGHDYGIWNGHLIPKDRSGWHPALQEFYNYWLKIAPLGGLPGRQHIAVEELTRLLPRLLLIDVCQDPLRFRYRLVGTEVVWSRQGDVTGQWVDEIPSDSGLKPLFLNRLRFMAETGLPTWRRGQSIWARDPKHHAVENCLAPLARDQKTVDMLFGVSVVFDSTGRELRK